MFAEVIRCSGEPGTRNGIAVARLLNAQLSQTRPLRPKRRKVNTGRGNSSDAFKPTARDEVMRVMATRGGDENVDVRRYCPVPTTSLRC
jgi:hypothetical protein